MNKYILSAFSDEIDEDLKTQMDVLDQYGIKYIEIRGVNGRNIVQHTLEEVKEIKKALDARGFKISAVGSPIGKILITDDFEPHLELFRHTLEIARILETPYVRMFSFFIPGGDEPAKHREQVLQRLSGFIEAAKGSGIVLLHENEKDIYGDIPERCLDILETMNCDYFRAAFDPANFVQCDAKTYPEGFELLEKYVVHMHIKDALYKDHSVVPAGYGDGRVKEILTRLYSRGYEGILTFEPHLAAFKGFEALELNPGGNTREDGSLDGPGQFSLAVGALKNILSEIENAAK